MIWCINFPNVHIYTCVLFEDACSQRVFLSLIIKCSISFLQLKRAQFFKIILAGGWLFTAVIHPPTPKSVTDLKIVPNLLFFVSATSNSKLTPVEIGYQKWIKIYILRWEPSPRSAFVKSWDSSLLILSSSILLHYIG